MILLLRKSPWTTLNQHQMLLNDYSVGQSCTDLIVKRTTLYHFELLLMLWYNKAHWDASTVEKAINFINPPNVVQADEDKDEA
jgi:hypothetical protein